MPIAVGTAPFTGSYLPASPLSILNGSTANGTWKIQVTNHSSSHTGTLTSWSLQIKTGDPNVTTDASGNYQFFNVTAGNYQLYEVLQAPYVETAPAGGSYSVAVTAGANASGKNFGNQAAASATPTGVTLAPAATPAPRRRTISRG